MPPLDCSVGKPEGHFLDEVLIWEGQSSVGGATPDMLSSVVKERRLTKP